MTTCPLQSEPRSINYYQGSPKPTTGWNIDCKMRYLAARLTGRAAMTSPKPPTLDHGAASVATNTTCRQLENQPTHALLRFFHFCTCLDPTCSGSCEQRVSAESRFRSTNWGQGLTLAVLLCNDRRRKASPPRCLLTQP